MGEELISNALLRMIGDKLYEKRKAAALEVEQIVKRCVANSDDKRIRLIVDKLAAEYANSNQANLRKGALLCLAAATVGLGAPTAAQLQTIVPSVLRSFTDPDARVRYYACEALYNIAKVARTAFLPYFNEVFDAMFRLCADSDNNVMNAIQFLDNLVKDIVVASPTQFNLAAFVPKLRNYLPVMSPPKRSFLISWISVLDSIPDLDMLGHLPSLLEGLMGMLSDPNKEIKAQAHKALLEFLVEIQATPYVDFAALGTIQVVQAGSTDDFTRLTAIKWLKELVQLSATSLVALYPAILGIVLANISHSNKDIAEISRQASDVLLTFAPGDSSSQDGKGLALDTRAILNTISAQLLGPTVVGATADGASAWGGPEDASRLEALRWVELLLSRAKGQVLEALPALMPALLDALTSPSLAVANGALGVFAAVARCEGQFGSTLASLLGRFRGPSGVLLLQRGGASVIRRLCGALGAEPVFIELALALQEEKDLAFAATLVQALNLILLTSPEVRHLREALAGAASPQHRPHHPHSGTTSAAGSGGSTSSGASLFAALYPCWSHSVCALLSLCFLAQAYDHACEIIQCYRWLPVGSEVLVQMDRLVQLLDAPCFTPLRLSLLQPKSSQALITALHSLLMLLPQSNAFRALSVRLQAVPMTALLQMDDNLQDAPVRAACAAATAAGLNTTLHASGPLQSLRTPQPWRHPLPPLTWAEIDLAGLLQAFCERQMQHFLLEVSDDPAAMPGTSNESLYMTGGGSRLSASSPFVAKQLSPSMGGGVGVSPRASSSGIGAAVGAGAVGPGVETAGAAVVAATTITTTATTTAVLAPQQTVQQASPAPPAAVASSTGAHNSLPAPVSTGQTVGSLPAGYGSPVAGVIMGAGTSVEGGAQSSGGGGGADTHLPAAPDED